MKTYGKFAALIVVIVGTLVWLAAGGIGESKTYYKTVQEVQQMGDSAPRTGGCAWAGMSKPAPLSGWVARWHSPCSRKSCG